MKNKILTIDPGPVKSGFCVFEYGVITQADKVDSLFLLNTDFGKIDLVLIEKIEARGMIAGNSVIDTAIMCGRLKQEFQRRKIFTVFIERRQVLNALKCKNDPAIIKLLRPLIKTKQGVKVTKDAWQAAALYYTFNE